MILSNFACSQDLPGVSGLDEAMLYAFAFVQQYRVDKVTGEICAAFDESDRTIDTMQRIWTQTEYSCALATRNSVFFRKVLLH